MAYHFSEILHVEADNMLYGNVTSLLPVLRSGYKGATYIHTHIDTYIDTYIYTYIHTYISIRVS